MDRRAFLAVISGASLAASRALAAPPAGQPYRVGVIMEGGPYVAAIEGLRDGLRELGFEEGTHFLLHVRDVAGDLRAVAPAARSLEREKVDLIYAVTTSITREVKQATTRVPIVFYAGSDPVAAGLVASFRKPGGRLTGVYSRTSDLTAKQLELLTQLLPKVRRVVTFYRRDNPIGVRSVQTMRVAARELKIELVERPVASTEELRAGLLALSPGTVDAYLQAGDGTIVSQTQMSVIRGGLASYGFNYQTSSQRAAKYVQRVLMGAAPGDLPVEQLNEPYIVINLQAARALGLTIPPPLLQRADQVIE